MGSRRRPPIAESVEAVIILTLRFARLANKLVDEGPYTRRGASWMTEEWSQCWDTGSYDAYGIF